MRSFMSIFMTGLAQPSCYQPFRKKQELPVSVEIRLRLLGCFPLKARRIIQLKCDHAAGQQKAGISSQ